MKAYSLKFVFFALPMAAVIFSACATAQFPLPKNVKVLSKIEGETTVQHGHIPDMSIPFLDMSAKKGGNGVINIEMIKLNDNIEPGGNDIWYGSALAIRIKDNDFAGLYEATPKAAGRIYGMGVAKHPNLQMTITTAENKARTEIMHAYNAAISGSDEDTVSGPHITIKSSTVEQLMHFPDGTVYVMVSVLEGDIEPENRNR